MAAEAVEVQAVRTGVEMPEIKRISKWHLLHEALRNGPVDETFEIEFGASARRVSAVTRHSKDIN